MSEPEWGTENCAKKGLTKVKFSSWENSKSQNTKTTTFQLKAYKSLQSLNEIIPSFLFTHPCCARLRSNERISAQFNKSTIFNFICSLPTDIFTIKYWWNFQFSKVEKFACMNRKIFMFPTAKPPQIPLHKVKLRMKINKVKSEDFREFNFRSHISHW